MFRLRKSWVALVFAALACIFLSAPRCLLSEQATASVRGDSEPEADGFESTGLTIAKRVDEVNLVFTVTDSHGKFVSRLPSTDFEFLDNQQNPQSIGYFQQQSNLPLRVGLLIDLSDSVRGRFEFEQKAASVFLKNILRPNIDKAFVVGFDSNVHLVADMTGDNQKLSKAIHGLKSNGETALYDAIIFSADKLRTDTEARVTRRAIILITDGLDTKSTAVLNDAQKAAARAGAVIYALSSNSLIVEKHPKGDAILDSLAFPTGGHILPAREESDLKHAFRQVETALRSQYAMGYRPAEFRLDGSFRSIEIKPRKKKLKVQCRRGYFAPIEASAR
jgi:Ca-activated chloride channel homolog